MKLKNWMIGATCVALLVIVVVSNGFANEPVFVRWLLMDDPGDRAIADYWERFERQELDTNGMIDLGTMLFYRGYPKDATRVFRAALDEDDELYEAWFRIGLVEHQRGELREARKAYTKCLKLLKGHGWCNFYLGLLEEQSGNAVRAMELYEKAFKYAPVLSDPAVNPELANSNVAFGARLQMMRQRSFTGNLPMPFMDPSGVKDARSPRSEPRVESPDGDAGDGVADEVPAPAADVSADQTTAPTVVPAPELSEDAAESNARPRRPRGNRSQGESAPKPLAPKPSAESGKEGKSDLPYGIPPTTSVSDEASLREWWAEIREALA